MYKWLAVLTFLTELAHGEAMLRIRPHIVVAPNSNVKLSQLVDGQNLSAPLTAELATISLSIAPAYGEKQEIANANLTSILRPLIQAERERSTATLHVVIPKIVTIDTTKREITTDLVQMEMMQAWQPLCSGCQLELEGLSLPHVDGIRDWTLRLKAELPKGSFSVPIDLVRENGAPISAWISGRMVVKRKVPIAKREIHPGERVTAADFNWAFRDTSYAVDGIPLSEEIENKRMKQGLRADETLWRGMLEKEKAIRAGELVQLKSSEGNWEVTMSMVAQQDAFIGDVVNLKNPKTNVVLMGQAVARGEAELR